MRDTVPALQRLKAHFQLGVVTNIDDDLFEASRGLLHTDFDFVITAQQAGAYKPDARIFERVLEAAQGPVLHVAQNPYHDILPATALGLDTVWINRPGVGTATAADTTAEPAPTWTFDSLRDFAAAIQS